MRRGWELGALLIVAFCSGSAGLAETARLQGESRETPSLRELAKARGKRIGTNFGVLACDPKDAHKPLADWREKYAADLALISNHFDVSSAGWQQFPGHSWIAKGEYCLDGNLEFCRWAQENNVEVMFHGLGYIQRGWPAKEPMDTPEQREAFRKTYDEYLRTFVGTFKGKVGSWDVINEHIRYGRYGGRPFTYNEFTYLKAWGAQKSETVYGIEYYVETIRKAREIDPAVKLVHLDYCNEIVCDKANAQYRVIKELAERGAKVDAVGFQLHQSHNFNRVTMRDVANVGPNAREAIVNHDLTDAQFIDAMRENVQRYADLGMDVWATEIDVNAEETDDAPKRQARQAYVFRKLMEVTLEFDNYKVYKLWGYKDPPRGKQARPADLQLFDSELKPKPAFWAVADALQSYWPETIAQDRFESGEADSRRRGSWQLESATVGTTGGYKSNGVLQVPAGGSAARAVDLSGTYNAHLSYRWRWKGTLSEGGKVLVEARTRNGEWKLVKAHDSTELALRRIEGDWHAGFATLDGLDGAAEAEVRIRAVDTGEAIYHLDELRVIADL